MRVGPGVDTALGRAELNDEPGTIDPESLALNDSVKLPGDPII